MIKISYEENLNAVIIKYSGKVDGQEMEKLLPTLRTLAASFKENFKVLADFWELEAISQDVREPLKKIMDFLNEKGVNEVLRIVPDSANDIGFNIMSAFHYSKDVRFQNVNSREEANARLAAWEVKLKTAFVEIKETWQKDFIEKNFSRNSVVFFEETAHDKADDLRNIDILSVFVNSRVTAQVMNKMPNLKCICTRSTGFDHIDLKEAAKRNITVCNVPIYGENTVAEHTLALILSISRNLRKAYLRASQNNFSLDGLMGFDLKNKTLGVIGTGHIGQHVIRMASGFGMKIIAYDVKKRAETLNFEYVELEHLLKSSDIITLHTPYLPSTHHMINKENIKLIKKGAVLINTSRGGLIETEALIQALDEKILSAAGLDVLEDEEYVLEDRRLLDAPKTDRDLERLQTTLKNHSLLHRDNVIFTPHMAFCSREAIERILETTAQNIRAFTQGRPENKVPHA